MAYDLKHFIDDCRTALKRDPGGGGRESLTAHRNHVRRARPGSHGL